MNNEGMRSPLGRALGLGSAKTGVQQWWRERVSALALVPLTVWFAASLIVHTGSDYATIRCSIGQLAPHDPRWRCHRMHHTVFGIEDVDDFDATHAQRIGDH
jgi:succinate dehydrogenase hydrophobic anchor subunit